MCAPKDDAKTKIDRLIQAMERLTLALLAHAQKDAPEHNLQHIVAGLQET